MKLKDVKKYFKNAKEVKCLYNGDVIDITQNIETPIHKFDEEFWISISNHRGTSVMLTDGNKFAEIISYKDTYTVSKDFILEAHESACSTFKTKIENQFPELFPKVEMELNKWYKVKTNGYNKVALICFDNDKLEHNYGFNHIGYFSKSFRNLKECLSDDNQEVEPATKEEVETALIAEAKKRGFKDGVRYIAVGEEEGKKSTYCSSKLRYGIGGYDSLCQVGLPRIYFNGKWAEIISEPIELSLDEIAEKFGVDVSLIKIKK